MKNQFYTIDAPANIKDPKFVCGQMLQAALMHPLFFAIDPEYIVNELASVLELCKLVGFTPSDVHSSARSQIFKHALTNPDFMCAFVDASGENGKDGTLEAMKTMLQATEELGAFNTMLQVEQ